MAMYTYGVRYSYKLSGSVHKLTLLFDIGSL